MATSPDESSLVDCSAAVVGDDVSVFVSLVLAHPTPTVTTNDDTKAVVANGKREAKIGRLNMRGCSWMWLKRASSKTKRLRGVAKRNRSARPTTLEIYPLSKNVRFQDVETAHSEHCDSDVGPRVALW